MAVLLTGLKGGDTMAQIQINDTLSVESSRDGDKLVLRIVRAGGGIVTIRPGEVDDLYHALKQLARAQAKGGET